MKLCLISARKTGEIEMFDMEQTAVKNFQNLMMHEGSQIPVSQISELMEKLTDTGIFIDLDYNSQDRNNCIVRRMRNERFVFYLILKY